LLSTFTLLTTTANELVRPVYDRMPVILDTDVALQWLACTPETAANAGSMSRSRTGARLSP
jgi:putative SOS response-associated peptidase YedK